MHVLRARPHLLQGFQLLPVLLLRGVPLRLPRVHASRVVLLQRQVGGMAGGQ